MPQRKNGKKEKVVAEHTESDQLPMKYFLVSKLHVGLFAVNNLISYAISIDFIASGQGYEFTSGEDVLITSLVTQPPAIPYTHHHKLYSTMPKMSKTFVLYNLWWWV